MIVQDWMVIVAGKDLLASMEAEQKATVADTGHGYESEALCRLQQRQAARGILGVEIVRSFYGHSVRYDSGLQNFGLVRSGRNVSLEDAVQWAEKWVAEDPSRRYAWYRKDT